MTDEGAVAEPHDALHGGIHALGMRVDALAAATSTFCSSTSDRLDEYASTVSRLSLRHAHDLDEYRRSTERVIGDLRRTTIGTDETIHRLDARVGDLDAEVGHLRADVAELRSLLLSGRGAPGADTALLHEVRDLCAALLDALPDSIDAGAGLAGEIADVVVERLTASFEVEVEATAGEVEPVAGSRRGRRRR